MNYFILIFLYKYFILFYYYYDYKLCLFNLFYMHSSSVYYGYMG